MKKIFATLALIAGLAITPAFADVTIGKTAPDHTFKDIMGTEHSIAKMKGKIVVLEWTNPGCPFVHKFYDHGDMPKIQAQAKQTKDVVWIAVNSSAAGKEGYFADDKAAQKDVVERKFAGDAYVRDTTGAFGKLYGAKTTPHMFVINKDGNMIYAGAIDSIKSVDNADIAKADNYALDAVAAAAKGEMPKVTSTQSYGCSVKYAD